MLEIKYQICGATHIVKISKHAENINENQRNENSIFFGEALENKLDKRIKEF